MSMLHVCKVGTVAENNVSTKPVNGVPTNDSNTYISNLFLCFDMHSKTDKAKDRIRGGIL